MQRFVDFFYFKIQYIVQKFDFQLFNKIFICFVFIKKVLFLF